MSYALELVCSLIGLAGLVYVARSMATKSEAGPQPRQRRTQSHGPASHHQAAQL